MQIGCRVLALLEEADPKAFAQLKAAATVLQKHWRGIQVRVKLLCWSHSGVQCCEEYTHVNLYVLL